MMNSFIDRDDEVRRVKTEYRKLQIKVEEYERLIEEYNNDN